MIITTPAGDPSRVPRELQSGPDGSDDVGCREKVRNVPAVVGICVGVLYLLISIGLLVVSLYPHSEP